MIRTDTLSIAICMTFQHIEEEIDAIFEITVEEYLAEPFSWGRSRGTEIEVGARLLSWHRHGEEYCRADAVEIEGEANVIRNEGFAAAEYADRAA